MISSSHSRVCYVSHSTLEKVGTVRQLLPGDESSDPFGAGYSFSFLGDEHSDIESEDESEEEEGMGKAGPSVKRWSAGFIKPMDSFKVLPDGFTAIKNYPSGLVEVAKYPSGPIALVTDKLCGEGADMVTILTWTFEVTGNSAWACGVIPVDETTSPQSAGNYLWRNGAAKGQYNSGSGCSMPRVSMKGPVCMELDLTTRQLTITVNGGSEKKYSIPESSFPACMGIAGHSNTQVTLKSVPRVAIPAAITEPRVAISAAITEPKCSKGHKLVEDSRSGHNCDYVKDGSSCDTRGTKYRCPSFGCDFDICASCWDYALAKSAAAAVKVATEEDEDREFQVDPALAASRVGQIPSALFTWGKDHVGSLQQG